MLRFVFFALLPVLLFGPISASAQESSSASGTQQTPSAPAPTTPPTVSAQVAAAEAAIASSDWKTAEAKLDAWLAEHPDDARALFDAGYVADTQNRLNDAASLYRRAVAANPESLEAHLMLGLLLARQGKLEEARPELVAATKLDPGAAGPELKARAWRALAQIDRPKPGSGDDPTQASNDLLEALKLSPETEADTLLAASLAEDAGQTDDAETAYRRVLAEDPASEPASSGLAHLLIENKQYPEAESLLRAGLEKTPGDPAMTAQLADVLVAEDNPEAVPLLEKLHDAHPADDNIAQMLAQVLSEAGDYAQSDQLYVKLLAAHPKDPDLLVAHGQNLILQLKYAEALAVFDKATQAAPGNSDTWSGLAFAAQRAGRPAVTVHALTMRSELVPDNASTDFLWATAYDALNQKKQAIAYYRLFLSASAGKFATEERQARQRLHLLER